MYAKQREAVVQHWRSMILRETRDLGSVDQVGARALNDPDVRDDPQVAALIRAALAERRAELMQTRRARDAATARPAHRTDAPGTTVPALRTAVDKVPGVFERLAQSFHACAEHGDEYEARAVLARMQALQQEYPGAIPSARLESFEPQLTALRERLQRLKERVATLTQHAVAASRDGDEEGAARALRRLASIHAAHPRLLDDARLEAVRSEVIHAAEHHEHRVAAAKLMERERAVAAEIKALGAVVREFHQAARSLPHHSDGYRRAEAVYHRALLEVRAHDREWFAGVILELADLLAGWGHPPPAVEDQVDHFLESIRSSLDRIRTEVREIEAEVGGS
ncbi:MAG: hypothetical protein HY763_01880 [Planctomycetes bacterium]|nr:hypothetical protein [Planctomycetota bacterium]